MSGMMIVAALVIVLAVALGPAHRRRSFNSFSPADPSRDAGLSDTDAVRTSAEVRAVSQRGPLRAGRRLDFGRRIQRVIPLNRARTGDRPARTDRAA